MHVITKRRQAGALHKENSMKPGKSLAHLYRSAFICGGFIFLMSAALPVFAQGGGKAEPLRIEFKRGANSTTVSGSVRNDEEYEYVLAAKKGQRLTIKITSTPVKTAAFRLLGEDKDPLC